MNGPSSRIQTELLALAMQKMGGRWEILAKDFTKE